MRITREFVKYTLAHKGRGIVSVSRSIGIGTGVLSDYLFRGKSLTEIEMRSLKDYLENEERNKDG